jgi:predicted SnoaL-like aldol condensation-catalyzing enzyme
MAATVFAAAGALSAHAADEHTYIIIPSGKKDSAKEEANKKLVLEWWREFWDKGDTADWAKWMAPDFRNHDPREPPVGAQALVDFLKHDRRPAPLAGEGNGTHGQVQPQLFAIADGDLVFIAHAPRGFDPNNPGAYAGDPARTFGGNVVRVKNGKIVEWWFTGGGGAPPANAPAAAASPAPAP